MNLSSDGLLLFFFRATAAQSMAADTVHRTKTEMRARASSFLETIRTRSNTVTSREDMTDTNSSSTASNSIIREARSATPQYLMTASDQFNFGDDQISTRSGSTSSEDLRSETTTTTTKNDVIDAVEVLENENYDCTNKNEFDKEEELCQLVSC